MNEAVGYVIHLVKLVVCYSSPSTLISARETSKFCFNSGNEVIDVDSLISDDSGDC